MCDAWHLIVRFRVRLMWLCINCSKVLLFEEKVYPFFQKKIIYTLKDLLSLYSSRLQPNGLPFSGKLQLK